MQHTEVAQMSERCREALRQFDEVMSGPPATEAIGALARSLGGQSLGVTEQYAATIECLDQAMEAVDLLRETNPAAEPQAVAARQHADLLADSASPSRHVPES